jgi:1-phosphatidylinositol-3-phosphate 5-kinase
MISTVVPTAAPTAMPTPMAFSPPSSIPNDQDDIKAMIESLPAFEVPKTPSPDSGTPQLGKESGSEYFDRPVMSASSSNPGTPGTETPMQLKTVADIALEAQVSQTKWQHEEHRRVWEWYLRKNKDDFVVEKYQCITLWEGKVERRRHASRNNSSTSLSTETTTALWESLSKNPSTIPS